MAKKATKASIEHINLPVRSVQAIQTTKYPLNNGGISRSCYGGFNLGLHVNDNKSEVETNRLSLLKALPENSQIQWLEQTHSNSVIVAENLISPSPSADAIITRTPHLALAIMTADCLPILLSNTKGNEIAAIHCGWRSTVNNIISNTLDKMVSKPYEVVAWLGPCISQHHFEVGEEVIKAFLSQDARLASFFIQNNAFKYQADLPGIATFLLKAAGVTSIIQTSQCTYSNNEKYYSYRRNKVTGRMASLICIK
ncbi:peptidoglycan editing factor PgeF [Thalassotalea piscium]|uniref:Purine nucleoside phosphorylase n=1 Tax=Thalassotalea piscium TaxID=1230533 RepID=A0A7X0NKJ3_9GAMM|nr:peptidoglycan editing factor PgeF [Thalassotalea piscium]MBB6545152.1 hypothetical protein [Thalassotalea piscium]